MRMVPASLSAAAARAVRELFPLSVRHARPGHTARLARRPGAAATAVVAAAHVDLLEPRCLLSAALDLVGVTALRNDPDFAGIDGSGVTVAVIDSGVDFSHPLLSGGRVAERDFVYNTPTNTITDEHGTHVAGIVGARDADIGVAPAVGLAGLQVFTETGSGEVGATQTDVEQALQWVLRNREQFNIVAVNLSLGAGNYTAAGSVDSDNRYDDIQRLEAAGVTVVAAAGNSYADLERPGSASPGILSTLNVGAVYEANEGGRGGSSGRDRTSGPDRITFFSQRPNTDNEVFAPGAVIESTIPGGGTRGLSGTSMASPLVAGVVALMQEAAQRFGGRLLSPGEVKSILRSTADQITDGDDEDTTVTTTGGTYRRVNAYRALRFIRDEFTGASPGNPDDPNIDPNGTIANAILGPTLGGAAVEPVGGNVGADGTTDVGGDDVDLYRFVVTSPGTVTLDVTNAGFGPVLRVFDATGAQVGSGGASLAGPLSAGTYYVGVSSSPNSTYDPAVAGSGPDGGTGNYDLTFALTTADPDGVLAAATAINLTSGREAQAMNFEIGADGDTAVGGGDVDIFQVTVPDDGNLLVDIDTLTDDVADTFVRVFDADGNQLQVSDDSLATGITGAAVEFDPVPGVSNLGDVVTDAGGNAAGHDTDSFVNVPADRGATYYIAVCNFANRNFNPTAPAGRVATGSTGEYSLFVSLKSRDFNGAIPQAIAEPTLPIDRNPGTIGTDGTPEGTVEVGDRDVDFVRLSSPVAGILELRVDSDDDPEVADRVDTVIRLFSADGTLLALNDDGGGGLDPVLRFEIDADTSYYAAVAGYGNDGFDPFLLGSGGSGSTGDYFFSAQVLPPSQAQALADDRSTDGQVKQLVLGQSVTAQVGDDDGFIRGAEDVDIYTFAAPFGGQFTFVTQPDDDFGADTFLRLFDAGGAQIAQDDNGAGGATGGSRIVADLTAGQTYLVGVNGAGPAAAAYNPVTGAGAAAGDTGGYTLVASAGLRSVTFGGRERATFTDADGSRVTVSLKGPGTGTVFFDAEGDADPANVLLEGTTEASTLTVKGATTVRSVTVNGALKGFSGKAANLAGSFAASGVVRSLAVADVTDAAITIGSGGGPITVSARTVFDASITSAAPIRSLKVASWTDSGGADDVVTAPAVAAVSAKGDFGASVVAGAVGKVGVGGQLIGDVRSDGNIDAVTARTVGPVSIFAGLPSGFTGLPDAADDFANPQAVLKSISVKGKFAGSFGPANVAAPTINKAALGFLDTSNDEVPFGLAADLVKSLGGNFDGFRGFRFKNLSDPSQSVAEGDAVFRVI